MTNGNKSNTLIQVSHEQKNTLLIIMFFLFFTSGMLVWLIATVNHLSVVFKETKTEVRILQMHVQDQNAILIRSGIIEPGDLTTGPTDPDKLKVKK